LNIFAATGAGTGAGLAIGPPLGPPRPTVTAFEEVSALIISNAVLLSILFI
jgi:hypothetical protein